MKKILMKRRNTIITKYNMNNNLTRTIKKHRNKSILYACRGAHNARRYNTFTLSNVFRDVLHRSVSGRYSRNLVSTLCLRNYGDLTPSKIRDIATICPVVQYLDLSGCYKICKPSMEIISEMWGDSLVSINLEFCHYINDEDLARLVSNDLYLVRSKLITEIEPSKLNNINLSHTKITDLGIRAIVTKCKDLNVLKIHGCVNLTDLSLSMVAKYCKDLEYLDISGTNIGNMGVQLILQECKNLKVLKLNDCKNIGNQILPYLCYYSKSLNRLYLRKTNVSNKGICYILQSIQLQTLSVAFLDVSDVVLKSMEKQTNLTLVDLSFCYNISLTSLVTFVDKVPTLTNLQLFGIPFSTKEKCILSRCAELANVNIAF
eukprot:TRINITY_DN12279_c0_g1_i1.p1 TRINITY_DN12279_c0_g1~~TRINITY_DN12279_c0_g1_i1.p1  ORF type:complete len:374 (+),score=33.42 TRINITY_DN12279_c0_g1_i1:125-1246(+)